MGIVETRVREHHRALVSRAIARDWQFLDNYSFSLIGRIWVGWNPENLHVQCVKRSKQSIHCLVTHSTEKWECLISVVYGLNGYEKRRELWSELVGMGQPPLPWVVLGDFNVVRVRDEACGGSPLWPDWKNDLASCLLDAKLEDLKYTGQFLTWSNMREEEPIMRKLDRVLVNRT